MYKVASSPTLNGIEKLINKYFYSYSYKVNESDLTISNKNGEFKKGIVKKEKNRYVFYML